MRQQIKILKNEVPKVLIDFMDNDNFDIQLVPAHGVPQERRRTLNHLRGKTEFLANETIKVNPNRGNKKESPRRNLRGLQITKAIRTGAKRN